MAYSDFNVEAACSAFGLELNQEVDLFASVPPVRASDRFRATMATFRPMVVAVHTEKARSEFIVAPILGEIWQLMHRKISLFSGTDFSVDPARGLNGTCDFIVGASPIQLFVRSPILMIVEAKNDNIKSGLGQCAAEMVGARLFNERAGDNATTIHGAVTTGNLWQFLRLEGNVLYFDRAEYYLEDLDKLIGILIYCVGGDPATVGAAA